MDGGVEGMEKGKCDGVENGVVGGLERGVVLHNVALACGGGGVGGEGGACSGGRRAPRMERGQGKEPQLQHASHRCVGSPYGTPPHTQRLSPFCTLSHI